MIKIVLLTLSSLLIIACSGGGDQSSSYLKRVWQSSGENLAIPESVIYDRGADLLYVSNVNSASSGNPWGDNGGFISRMDKNGKIVDLKWITGLKAPKGLILDGKFLYVADLDTVVKIDTQAGKILEKYQAPQGVNKLNDIVYDSKRKLIYVSNSSSKEIYSVNAQGEFASLYGKEKSPKAAQNGLFIDNDDLVMQGAVGYLKALALAKHDDIKTISDQVNIAIDGISKYHEKGYLISTWDGEIHFVGKNGTSKLLLDSKPTRSADIFYSSDLDLLLVPDFRKHIIAYKIKKI